MAAATLRSLVNHLHRLTAPEGADELNDCQLLERFSAGDEEAFAVVVRRHGPMVMGVCRRELGHEQDAEDAFQATFLVLARKAAVVRWRPSIAGWLFESAHRLASEAKRKARRRETRERKVVAPTPATPPDEAARRELYAVLNEELARLPERYRSAVLLCVLGGKPRDVAAGRLGCSLQSLKYRLEQGRELLRQRLSRRGWDLSAALLVASLGGGSSFAITARRAALIARSARDFVAGSAATASPNALALAGAALKAVPLARMKLLAPLLLAVGLVGSTAGLLLQRGAAGQPPRTLARADEQRDEPADRPQDPARKDASGDPLPAGALLRFGTTRFRHPGSIQTLTLSPDGKALATAGGTGFATIQLMDAATGRVRHVIRGVANDSGISSGQRFLAFAPDGKTLASGGRDGIARLYDAGSGKEVRKLPFGNKLGNKGEIGMIHSVAFSPDGKGLAAGLSTKQVSLWDLKADKELWRQATGGSLVHFSPGGKAVAVLAEGRQDTVALLDAASGKELRRFAHGAKIIRAAFSPNGELLATTGEDHARVWDAATGKELHAFKHTLEGEQAATGITAVTFSPGGGLLATASRDGHIRLWDLKAGKLARTLKGHGWRVMGLAFAPDGKTLYSGSWDSTIRRWDVAAGKEIPGPEGYTHSAWVAYSADGTRLATTAGLGAGGVHVWDAAGKRLRTIDPDGSPAHSLALVRDGSRLATGHTDGGVRLWDVHTGRLLHTLNDPVNDGNQNRIAYLAFSPGEDRLAAAGGPRDAVHVWTLGKKPSHRQLAHQGASAVAWSPDGRTLVSGGWDRKIRFWDAVMGKQLAEIDAGDIVDDVAFSPDGRLLASGHHRKPILLWDVASRRLLRELEGHRSAPGQSPPSRMVWSVSFSPDGLWLASGGLDGTARLWDPATGKEVQRREGHGSWVTRVIFGPRGRTLLTGSFDTTALLWDLRPKLEPLAEGDAPKLWDVLAGADSPAVYRAVWALAENPKASLPLLREKLKAARPPLTPQRFKKLLADLDSRKFEERETATAELSKVAAEIESALRQALKQTQSAEVKRRLKQVLASILTKKASPQRLRQRRAVAVLEQVGTPEARELLKSLADGAPSAPLTRDAKAALKRLRVNKD